MKIQEIRVNRYGPLSNIIYERTKFFTLVYGKNETGKTLLLDALLRLCLSRKRDLNLFRGWDRVDYDPDGYVEITRGDETFRLPNEVSLPEVLDIHPEDLRNVLVVRASDLQFPEDAEPEYYASLTDRLMGIHRESILSIREELEDIGRLTNPTSSGKLSDDKSYGKIKTKINTAKNLNKDINQIDIDQEGAGPTALEDHLFKKEEDLEESEEELQLLEHAKKRDEYHSSLKTLEQLKENREQLGELVEVNQEQSERWSEYLKTINKSRSELEKEGQELEEYQEQLASIKTKHAEDEQRLESFQRKGSVVDELKEETEDQARKFKFTKGLGEARTIFRLGLIILGVLLVVSITGLILRPELTLLKILTVVFGFVFFTDGLLLLAVYIQKARTESSWESLRLKAEQHGFQVDSFEKLLESVESIKEDIDRAQKEYGESGKELSGLRARIDERNRRINKLRETISEAEESIRDLKENTGFSSIKELKERLDQRLRLKEMNKELITRLEERYDMTELPLKEQIQYWENEVTKLEKFSDAAPGIEYQSQKEQELSSTIETLKEEIGKAEEELRGYRRKFEEIAREANGVISPDEAFPGETVEDMKYIQDNLEEFVNTVEKRKENAIKAIRIFEQIEEEEEEKVKDLFGEDDLASKYFREITNGAYESVEYDPSERALFVKRPNGDSFQAYQLSSGAYDQLYFATRLSLANQILGGEKGFLLLDDPFLAADSTRLAKQLDMLVNRARDGWQIIYFSVKNEVREYLKDMENEIEFIKLPGFL